MRKIDRLLLMKRVSAGITGCSLSSDDGKIKLDIVLQSTREKKDIIEYFNSLADAYKRLDDYIEQYGVAPGTVFIIEDPNMPKGRFNDIDATIIIDDIPDFEE